MRAFFKWRVRAEWDRLLGRFGAHNFNSPQTTFVATKSEHNFGPFHTHCTMVIMMCLGSARFGPPLLYSICGQ